MTDTLEILLVDDNPADSDLVCEVLAQGKHSAHVSTAVDGEEAMAFLQHQGRFSGAAVPNLVMLDLNLPRKDGRAVLAEVRASAALRQLPVVVFSTSQARHDIQRSYELGANCYVTKPGNLQDFVAAIRSIEEFWLGFVRLPN
jgi:CheY-like chemotaxis protein